MSTSRIKELNVFLRVCVCFTLMELVKYFAALFLRMGIRCIKVFRCSNIINCLW